MLKPRHGFTPEKVARSLRKEPQPAPEPAPPARREYRVNINVGDVASAAWWAWGRWDNYKKGLAAEDQRVLELAYQNYGWLTEPQIMEALGFSATKTAACLQRLIEAGLARPVPSRHGQTIYLFEKFLPLLAPCPWCDRELIVGETARCPSCGAPASQSQGAPR